MNDRKAAEISHIRNAHENYIATVYAEHEAAIEKLKAEHSDAVRQLQTKQENQMEGKRERKIKVSSSVWMIV